MRAVVVVAIGVLMLGCEKPPPRTPEAAWRLFSEALRTGDMKTAYGSLSAPTRAAIEQRSKAISAASQGVIKDEPGQMVFAFSGVKPLEMGAVKVLQASDSAATLEVTAPGRSQQVKMVREGDRWAVDLSEVFANRADP